MLWYSAGKPLTTVAILQLWERSRLGLREEHVLLAAGERIIERTRLSVLLCLGIDHQRGAPDILDPVNVGVFLLRVQKL